MIKAVIIDDELKSCTSLFNKLKTHCPDVEVLEICNSGEEGLRAIRELSPDLVFLEIEMPVMNGFAMLGQVEKKDFEEIGRASCRVRVCQYVSITVGAGYIKKK